MSFIKDHPNISPILKLHILELQAKANIIKNENNQLTLQRIEYLSKTRMFDRLLKQVQNLKDLQFPTLKQKVAIAKQKNLQEKKALGQDNIKKIISDLYNRSVGDDQSQDIDLGQMNVYKLAKILFDQGNYDRSHEILVQLEKQGLKDYLWLRVPWARLYNEVLKGKEDSKKTIETVRKRFEEIQNEEYKSASKNRQETSKLVKTSYAQKQEFLALATVIFFNKTRDEDLQRYVDFCNQKSYFSVIQLLCPYLLRYLVVAALVNKNLHKNRNYSFDFYKLTEIIKRGIVKYTDPFTQLIQNLYLNFDFESAINNIIEIQDVINNDIFLLPLKERVIESCQFLYFKVYCKIHESITIKEIADFIKKTELQAELWILKYIRSSDIEAKIDSIEGKVISMRNKQNRAEKYVNMIPDINTLLNTMSHSQIQQE